MTGDMDLTLTDSLDQILDTSLYERACGSPLLLSKEVCAKFGALPLRINPLPWRVESPIKQNRNLFITATIYQPTPLTPLPIPWRYMENTLYPGATQAKTNLLYLILSSQIRLLIAVLYLYVWRMTSYFQ